MRRNSKRPKSRRRGVGTLELILALPMLVIVLVAIFEFTMLMILQSTVTHSATVGAREAGKDAQMDELVEIVQAMVAPNCIVISDEPGSGTMIVLESGNGDITKFGDPTMNCTLPPNPVNPDEMRVTVCVSTSATGICDALGDLGFSIWGRCLQASSLVQREHPLTSPSP